MLTRRLGQFVASLSVALLAACAAVSGDDADSTESAIAASAPHVLAIGDSITFAWNPNVEKDLHKVDATKYRGYAEILGAKLGRAVDNIACPGETSGALLDPEAEDNGCRISRAAYRLHHPWSSESPTADTQIEVITAYLQRTIREGNPPEMITMTMGGNDLLLIKRHCDLPSVLAIGCQVARLPFTVHAFGDHIDKTLQAIHDAGYRGKVVLLSTYAFDYSDTIASLALRQMNSELAEHVRKTAPKLQGLEVRVADAYAAFEAKANEHGGKTCATGLLIANPDGTCDIHPTAAGHVVLANAVLEALK